MRIHGINRLANAPASASAAVAERAKKAGARNLGKLILRHNLLSRNVNRNVWETVVL
jgi:hypothetical protein